ncbi:MAG TPA: (Fe-S)-binding protein [Rudaea sp.]|nr:(Fe-S)-binding protein [Rudaea sp.]
MPIHPEKPAAESILALADRCVKCGLCQPQCPTYRVARDEAESPRGRIALARGLAAGDFDDVGRASAERHLDQCLACMSCERVCPSEVRYSELLVATRALLRRRRGEPLRERLLRSLAGHPRFLGVLLRVANLHGVGAFVRSRIVRSVLRPIGLGRLAAELPRLPKKVASMPSGDGERGRIGIFTGCVAASVDRDVHVGAARLLGALGYASVLAPPRCCGALALHSGDVAAAHTLGTAVQAFFTEQGVRTVLATASGCFGSLRAAFGGSGIDVRDAHDFLLADERFARLRFRPLAARVAVHTPCTQANVVRSPGGVAATLRRIPQVEIVTLPDEPRCCGAGGDYFLRHAGITDALRTEKIDQALAVAPDFVATSNVGCRVFLENGLARRDARVRIVHPVALLAAQLEN